VSGTDDQAEPAASTDMSVLIRAQLSRRRAAAVARLFHRRDEVDHQADQADDNQSAKEREA